MTWVDRTSKLIVARAIRQGNSSAKVLANLDFESICCCFGLPARLTHDNDVSFRSMWKELWLLFNTKITCTSAYNPQADPAERANWQVLEALRAAVSSVTDFNQWDQEMPHLCFGLNTHPSSVTNTLPFELVHGFPARMPLTLDLAAHARDDVVYWYWIHLTSTPQCIRQPRPRVYLKEGTYYTRLFRKPSTHDMKK